MATVRTEVSVIPPPPSYEEAIALPPQVGSVPPPPSYEKATEQPRPTTTHAHNPPITRQPRVSTQRVVLQQTLGKQPVQMRCPMCRHVVVTRLEHTPGALAWVLCATLALLGCVCGCCIIPFFFGCLRDVVHWCPRCHNVLGVYRHA